jgi:ADP-heptose:LPS heptosyltransferase
MQFKAKLFLDRTLGHILCLFADIAAWIIGKILRRDHSIDYNNIGVIVIAKYFGIGSITHCVPMLRALKNKYPRVKLIFITRKSNREIIELIHYVDKALYIEDKSIFALFISNIFLIFNLWREKIDLFFDLEVFSAYSTLVSLFSLARNRLGFFWAKSTWFKTFSYTHLMYFNFSMPLRMSYMQLAKFCAVSDASLDLEPFNLTQKVHLSAHDKLDTIVKQEHKGLIGINVNASELAYIRRWSLKKFAYISSYFADKGYGILLFGSKDEEEYIEKIFDLLPKDAKIRNSLYNIAGKFTLPEILVLMNSLACFITNDSGLMNLAYAQKTKTVSIYGANYPDYVHIDNAINVAIYKHVYCSPCLYIFDKPPCVDHPFCIENISEQEVINAAENVLTNNINFQYTKKEIITYDKNNDYVLGTLRRK